MIRKTYAKIDEDTLKNNIEEIRKNYPDYKYYIGVVKNNAYHHGISCLPALIEGGINYLAVSSLEEALEIRKLGLGVPILCLEVIDLDYVDTAVQNDVALTVESLAYLEKLTSKDLKKTVTIHLALDTGMHRLGFLDYREVTKAVKLIYENPKLYLEGIYSHFATSGVTDPHYDNAVAQFLDLTKEIALDKIPIVHFGRSLSLVQHEPLPFCNGIRLGIVMYGLSGSITLNSGIRGYLQEIKRKYYQKKNHCSKTILTNNLNVKPAMSLYTQIMSKREVAPSDYVGYGAAYQVKEKGFIYTLPIGYADGVTKDFQSVVIDGHFCPIVADCMDMLLIFSKESFEVGEQVEIFGSKKSLKTVCQNAKINSYHLFNQISNRVPRIYVRGGKEREIKY